jgi:hypothetical protein
MNRDCWYHMPPDCSGASFVFTKFNPMSRLSGIVAGNLALRIRERGKSIIQYTGEIFYISMKR